MRKAMSAAVLFAVLGVIDPGGSEARSTPAALGRVTSAAFQQCVTVSTQNGWAINTCTGFTDWVLGLPLDSNGLHNGAFTMLAKGPTTCRAIGISREGTGASISGDFGGASHTQFQTFGWQVPFVPSNGLMFMSCRMGAGTVFTKADHSPS